jgi:hypothetical protein
MDDAYLYGSFLKYGLRLNRALWKIIQKHEYPQITEATLY